MNKYNMYIYIHIHTKAQQIRSNPKLPWVSARLRRKFESSRLLAVQPWVWCWGRYSILELGYSNQCCEIVPRIENWQIWGTSPHYGLHICMVSRYFWVSFSGVSSSYELASAATSASSHHHLSPFMDVLFELYVAIPKKLQVTVSMD